MVEEPKELLTAGFSKNDLNQIICQSSKIAISILRKRYENDFQKLNDVDKEYFLEIARKQLIELKRNNISHRVFEAEENYGTSKIKYGSKEELMKDLNGD